jgi:nucleotide-binding universal stress UspA family protein
MNHKLLVVLETGGTSEKVAEYLARALSCGCSPDAKLVLFAVMPGLPPWIEAGEAVDATVQRDKIETERQEQTAKQMAGIRKYLVEHGVSDEIIPEETADSTLHIVPEILEAAKQHDCDTIVMARHHKSMIREFFTGDTAEKLLRHPTGFTVWLVE